MSRNKTADVPRGDRPLVTAAEWFAGGQRIAYGERVPQAEIMTFPGGHLTTGEHPDLRAAAIREIAVRHGVGTPATACR